MYQMKFCQSVEKQLSLNAISTTDRNFSFRPLDENIRIDTLYSFKTGQKLASTHSFYYAPENQHCFVVSGDDYFGHSEAGFL